MFKTEDNRAVLAYASSILCWLLAVLGTFATTDGVLQVYICAIGFILTIATVCSIPFVPDKANLHTLTWGLFAHSVLALGYGCVVFKWWGIAYFAGAHAAFLVSWTVRTAQTTK
ncbi:MAG: hypothetical protein K2W95_31925 [Candidatus Obscuribacterales bacterium]|nr:hypothetical protein [Candidatus Obscuribacterales bacterium]